MENKPILKLSELEKLYIIEIYGQMKRNKSKTAQALGISLRTLYKKLEKYEKEQCENPNDSSQKDTY